MASESVENKSVVQITRNISEKCLLSSSILCASDKYQKQGHWRLRKAPHCYSGLKQMNNQFRSVKFMPGFNCMV